jgi:hypothetical protein
MLTELQTAMDDIRMGMIRRNICFHSWILYGSTKYARYETLMYSRACFALREEYNRLQEGGALKGWPR